LNFSSAIDHGLKMIADSLERICHASSIDAIQTISNATIEFLKLNDTEELCVRFTDQLPSAISKWQSTRETTTKQTESTDDNLNEENMDVDDEHDERYRKQLSNSEYNDVDYRFLDQDMDHRVTLTTSTATTSIDDHERLKNMTRKSRFLD
jgi:hypothetical protein